MPARSRHGRWACSCFRVSRVRRCIASLLAARRMSGMAIGVVGALVLGWAELANIWTGTANGPAARSTALRSRMDVDRRCLRTLALARALSRRSRRSGSRGARTRRSRRGSDRGRCGRGVRGAHARLDRTLAPQLDCAAAARRRARLLVAARRHGRHRSRTAAGARGPERPCAGRTRPSVPWDQARLDRPAGHGFGCSSGTAANPGRRRRSSSRLARASKPAAKPATESHRGPIRQARVTVDLVLRGRRDRAGRARPRRVARGAPALHAIGMAAGAAATGGRRACRPGHRCVGMDANAAGSVSAAAGRRRSRPTWSSPAVRRTMSRQTSSRRCGRSRRRRRPQPFRASNRLCAPGRRRVDGGRRAERIGTRAPDEERSRAPRIPWSGFVPPPPDENVLQVTSHWKVVLVGGKRTRTTAAIIVAASGIVLCFALVEGLGVFGNDKVSTPIVASSTKPVSTPTRTATEPTIPRPARVPPPSADARARRHGPAGERSCSGRLRRSAFRRARPMGTTGRLRSRPSRGSRHPRGCRRSVSSGPRRSRRYSTHCRGGHADGPEIARYLDGLRAARRNAARAVPGGRQRHPRGSPTLAELELPLGREREESLPADRVRPVVVDVADGDPRRRHQHRLRATAEHRPQNLPAVRRARIHRLHPAQRPDEHRRRCLHRRLQHPEEHASAAQQPRVAGRGRRVHQLRATTW